MWLVAVGLGILVVAASVLVLTVAARLLPPGPMRELAAFVPNAVVLLRRLRGDRRLPWRARAALGAALGYLVSPIQVIPNFIPVVGQTDDVFIVTLALRYACRQLPPDQVRAAWPGDAASLDRLLGSRDRRVGDPPHR